MIENMRTNQVILLTLFLRIVAAGQPIRLPLDGYYRPGEYMPVNLETNSRMTLQTDGAMNTRISHSGVVPMFTLSATADQLRIGGQTFPIRALQSNEKLVGFSGRIDAAIAQQIFPEGKIVPVSLDSADPMPGPAMAWSSLDAVVLDAPPGNLNDLLAAGITIVIRGSNPPDATHDWRLLAGGCMVSGNLFPPHPALLGEDAYLPAQSWTPQMPEQLREMILLVSLLIACVMLGTLLLSARWRLPALGVVVLISSTVILVWKNEQPAASKLTGAISRDQWIYETSPRANEIKMPLDRMIYPVFASPSQAASMHAILDADHGVIMCDLPAGATMAFVRRNANAPSAEQFGSAEQFLPLARRAYLQPGTALRIEDNRIVIDQIETKD